MPHISDNEGKVRKGHNCRVCDERICAGDFCHMYTGVESPDGFYTLYFHLDCWRHSRDWDCWDWDRFMPGDMSRGEVKEQIRAATTAN